MLTSQYDTGNGVEESVRFLLLSLYDLEFGVEESTGLLHVQYGWIDGVEESRTQQDYITLLHFDTVLLELLHRTEQGLGCEARAYSTQSRPQDTRLEQEHRVSEGHVEHAAFGQ